jgi:hypothetical protein
MDGPDYAKVVFSVTLVVFSVSTTPPCWLELPLRLASSAGALAFIKGQCPLVSLKRMAMKLTMTKIQ